MFFFISLLFHFVLSLDDQPVEPPLFVQVYLNGGNNTEEGSASIAMPYRKTDDFEEFLERIAVKLNIIPHDCTEWSISRPKRPWEFVVQAPDVEREPNTRCSLGQRRSWTSRTRLFDANGLAIKSLTASEQWHEPLSIVAPGDHFVWSGQYEGRKVELSDATVNDEPIELITLSLTPRIFYIPKFVTDKEAELIIEHSNSSMGDSWVFDQGKTVVLKSRNSQQTWLECNKFGSQAEQAICDMDQRVAAVTRLPYNHVKTHSDSLQIVRYLPGQHYHSHHDYFDATLTEASAGIRDGQQRLFTLFWYLNDVEEGGETVFPRGGSDGYGAETVWDMGDCSRGIKVKPKKGSAILWYNLKAMGNGHEAFYDFMTLHGGCDVKQGVKFAANKWVYNRKSKSNDFAAYRHEWAPPPPQQQQE